MGSNWRDGFQFAWQLPDPDPNEGPGLTWQQLDAHHWSGSWNGKLHGTITAEAGAWLAYLRLEDPPGLSPITTVGRYEPVKAAQLATDEVWGPDSRRQAVLRRRRLRQARDPGAAIAIGALCAPWTPQEVPIVAPRLQCR